MVIPHTGQELAAKLDFELRRGTLVLAVLTQLGSEKYGYSLVQDLAEQGLEVEQGTLYPLLRRLDEQGVLESRWNTDGSRPRKYYRLSATGTEVLEILISQWKTLVEALDGLIADREGDKHGTV